MKKTNRTSRIPKIVVTTFIPEELYEKIRNQAFQERVSISELIRNACKVYLQTKENKNGTKKTQKDTP